MHDVTDERPDAELLEDFTRNRSEAAFAAIVGRYVGLVHSVALRHTAVPAQTQDITQAVFIILARKAGSLGRHTVLSGWLYHTARLTAANQQRAESRRIRREQEAYMQATMEAGTTPVWDEVSPQLDEAMAKLGSADRDALVLRYFENKNLTQVGAALGIEERAAQKRVGRALEKLRKILTRRGVTLPAAVIAVALSANAVQAAPTGLALTVTGAATGGTAFSATITTLINETMKTMTWLKLKFAAGVGAVTLLAGITATVAVSQIDDDADSRLTAPEIVQKSAAAYAALTSYRDDGQVVATVGTSTVSPIKFSIRLARPGFYRIETDQKTGTFDDQVTVWSAGRGNRVKRFGSVTEATDLQAGVAASGEACDIPGTFFKLNWGNQLGAAMKSARRAADARVEGVDCYVLTHVIGGTTGIFWIGKRDWLIRQIEQDTTAEANQAMIDGLAKAHPEQAGTKALLAQGGQAIKNIETHEHIVVNAALTPADFEVGAGK